MKYWVHKTEFILILIADLPYVSKKDFILLNPVFSPIRMRCEPEAKFPLFHNSMQLSEANSYQKKHNSNELYNFRYVSW